MFGSGILDTIIGLIFVFLLVSLLVTTVNEMIAAALRSRARWLRYGIGRMLGADWAAALYRHPLIAGSARTDSKSPSSGPSYIPSRAFANVLMSIIHQQVDAVPTDLPAARSLRQTLDALPAGDLKLTLLTLYADAGHDLDRFKANIEVWFNNGMDRVNGWYKRRSQGVTIVVATVIVIAVNVDALAIFRHLQTYPALGQAIVGQATQYAHNGPPPAAGDVTGLVVQFETLQTRLQGLTIPIGWSGVPADWRDGAAWWRLATLHGTGWILTILAAMLGAPFWFDMLNRVISIRAAGKPPEEDPKPPKSVSVPVEPGQSQKEADRLRR